MKEYISKITISIILIIGCLMLLNVNVKAQQVHIEDTTITTDIVSLPVLGNTEDWNGKTIEYRFKVSWPAFELLDVVAESNSAVLDKNIKFSYDWQERLILVTINSIQSNFSYGNLFNIVIKVLTRVDFYRPNEIFEITPQEIIIKDASNSNTIKLESNTAYVRIEYMPNNLTYIEDVSLNYPNPFLTETTILFSVTEETDVSFEIYNILGTLVKKIPNKDNDFKYDAFRYEIYNMEHIAVPIEDNNKLEKGIYCLRLNTNKIESSISISIYYLLVRIGTNTHLIKMCIN